MENLIVPQFSGFEIALQNAVPIPEAKAIPTGPGIVGTFNWGEMMLYASVIILFGVVVYSTYSNAKKKDDNPPVVSSP